MLVHEKRGDDARFADLCREHGWRRTAQRRAVFNLLCGDRSHPTVDAVWQDVKETLPEISLDSVYRILDDFSGVGLVRRLTANKVIRYDADTSPHEHFLCQRCQRLFDFSGLDPKPLDNACRRFGQVTAIEVTVHGICRDCLERGEAEAAG
ncbi:MAG: transcriptional repressor [Planctomycetes bacterium]|nr:transcriptional repressor [Planctomycetota bacterium]MCD7897225.1 transcriptional repressor [Planctomycetaceae bacterium]